MESIRLFGAGSMGRVPDGERFPCLTFLFMDPLGPDPIIRFLERHLYAENRSSRTVREGVALQEVLGPGPAAAVGDTAPRMPLQPTTSRSAGPLRRAHLSNADEDVTTTGSSDHGVARSPKK
jgi:hypothetical protein